MTSIRQAERKFLTEAKKYTETEAFLVLVSEN